MRTGLIRHGITISVTLAFLILVLSSSALPAPTIPVSFTILHTNDFHGQLEASGSNPGIARVATVVNNVRAAVGAAKVILVDAGDEMQGSLLSNLEKGEPTIAAFNATGYNLATFGNHDFDWGQTTLAARTSQATYPFVTANIVKNNTGDCATAGWTKPDFADAPYRIVTIGTAPNAIKIAFIGVTTTETPSITVASATSGLCFKDPADSIIHYYDTMKATADVIVVLSHLGYADGGYGYGIPVYGDQTLAGRLNSAGKSANLIVGGHSHTNLSSATTVGSTIVTQAYYNGRTVGRADVTVGSDSSVGITWTRTTGFTAGAEDPAVKAVVTSYASNPTYMAMVNQPVGYSAVDLGRSPSVDNMMSTFIDDAIYNQLNSDGETGNDVDIIFNNAGGIRTDWCYSGGVWINTGCVSGIHAAGLLTYGNMFTILPFGNSTAVGQMTGAQILEVLNYGPNVSNGVIQPAGLRYKYFSYKDVNPGPQPYAWGTFDITVYNKTTRAWEGLDLTKTYRVGTNEFLTPAGGDGYNAFRYMTNITYWGDMLNAVNAYVSSHYGTVGTAYKGPDGTGNLDGRIDREGSDSTGSIIPLTILHHNDSHGYLAKGTYVGYTQLATLIKQEKAHNPDRTLLLSAGDNIQGDAMMYYFRTAPGGYASDGTYLGKALSINPLIKAFNSMGYDAMTLGNHEFNFGKDVFTNVLSQANFPLLQANVKDSGAYGLSFARIQATETKSVGPEGIKVAIMGIGNHLIPQFELPTNIAGLSFSNPLTRAQALSNSLRPDNDVVIALTHIGFTADPASAEVDTNVDTNLAASVTGINAVIGGHSHTNPASGSSDYKYLPTIVADPDGKPVVTTQAYRYNNTLGEVILGLRATFGGYDVVSQTGRYLTVATTTTEDEAVKAIVDPYAALLTTYNNTTVGATITPIDALQAFTRETNGANLQADASVYELKTLHGIPVDFHLSGAMTNSLIASGATPAGPFRLKVSDMFTAMPYENSLVVISMNGPQLKAVLERAYRNYYYYKNVPGYGGYSYYTTCMLDTDSAARITYDDRNPILPNGNNVVSLTVNGTPVDFKDTGTYYNVSTINYLAAGSCNFNDGGVTLWPLNQIEHDTQYYVRDAVIDYIAHLGTVNPLVEGRLTFANYFTVSGTLGSAGAGGVVAYTGGSTMADAVNGNYSFWVPNGWSGTVTPGKTDTRFMPASRTYLNVVGDMSGQNYTVLPTVTGISPSIGSAAGGTTVTISGTGFAGATAVAFGRSGSTFTLNSPNRITAISPTGSAWTTVHITVTTPAGSSATSAADQFTYANVAKNVSTGGLYTSLSTALAAAFSGNEIRILDILLDGDVILDRAVSLYGGWDTTFLSQGAQATILNGSLTVEGGDLTARSLVVKGILAVREGRLNVNYVTLVPQE